MPTGRSKSIVGVEIEKPILFITVEILEIKKFPYLKINNIDKLRIIQMIK